MEIKGITGQQQRATAAERLQMVEHFRRSGLTRAAFSQRYGIPVATLGWWLTKAKRDARLPVPVQFREISLAAEPVLQGQTWAMEVVAPSGLTIRCREALSGRELVRLLRGTRC